MSKKNSGCRSCRHFRAYRPLSQVLVQELSADRSATLLSELNRFISAEGERRDFETQARIEVVEQGRFDWPLRPSMSDYCGEREEEGVYYLHEVRNAEHTCKSFDPLPRDSVHRCADCVHFRPGQGNAEDAAELMEIQKSSALDAYSGTGNTSSLMEELIAAIDQRKLSEAAQCYYGLRFSDRAPRYLASCASYSVSSGDFVPCALQNAHHRCPRFETRAAPEAEEPARDEPKPKRKTSRKGLLG